MRDVYVCNECHRRFDPTITFNDVTVHEWYTYSTAGKVVGAWSAVPQKWCNSCVRANILSHEDSNGA